jgi:hypothetical protein
LFVGKLTSWEDNIKMNLKEVISGRHGMGCVAEDGDRWRAVVNAVMNLSFVN